MHVNPVNVLLCLRNFRKGHSTQFGVPETPAVKSNSLICSLSVISVDSLYLTIPKKGIFGFLILDFCNRLELNMCIYIISMYLFMQNSYITYKTFGVIMFYGHFCTYATYVLFNIVNLKTSCSVFVQRGATTTCQEDEYELRRNLLPRGDHVTCFTRLRTPYF